MVINATEYNGKLWPNPNSCNPVEALEYLIAAREYIAQYPPPEGYIQHPRSDDHNPVGGNINRPAMLDASYEYFGRYLISISIPNFIPVEQTYTVSDSNKISYSRAFSNEGINKALRTIMENFDIDYSRSKMGFDNERETLYVESYTGSQQQYLQGREIISKIVHGNTETDVSLINYVRSFQSVLNPIEKLTNQEKELDEVIQKKLIEGNLLEVNHHLKLDDNREVPFKAIAFLGSSEELSKIENMFKSTGVTCEIVTSGMAYDQIKEPFLQLEIGSYEAEKLLHRAASKAFSNNYYSNHHNINQTPENESIVQINRQASNLIIKIREKIAEHQTDPLLKEIAKTGILTKKIDAINQKIQNFYEFSKQFLETKDIKKFEADLGKNLKEIIDECKSPVFGGSINKLLPKEIRTIAMFKPQTKKLFEGECKKILNEISNITGTKYNDTATELTK